VQCLGECLQRFPLPQAAESVPVQREQCRDAHGKVRVPRQTAVDDGQQGGYLDRCRLISCERCRAQFLCRARFDQTGDDLDYLDHREHVSGPSAAEYRRRLQHTAPFAGRVVDKARNAERLLTSSDPSIHHGRGMTCVYLAETARCRTARLAAGLPADGPDESSCQSACTNLAYTDRDINVLRDQQARLVNAASDPLSPLPLRDRARTQADQLSALIARHEGTRQTGDNAGEEDTP
jgi:hypothetical protein